MMTIAAARGLTSKTVCFVGIGIPSAAANLARLTHAPDVVLIYESGTIGAKPEVLPLSIGDGELADTADAVVSVPEIFRYWLQGGRVHVGFLGAAQVDKYGRLNTTMIGGSYEHPTLRLPGAGGAPEIATSAKEVWIVLRHSKRTLVDALSFVTSSGFVDKSAPGAVYGRGATTLFTDLCVMRSDPETNELVLTDLHPGVTLQQVKEETGWQLRISPQLGVNAPPTEVELNTLRDLHERTLRAHGEESSGAE
jgi:acyl CoA:acetate/3-ketoacid CoA transferase beta subunit